ncbi:MAG TPA: ADOP family duplicated permease [Acidobacteriaceae bacterium]|jgi:predicted permease|nr:ADOP family duplicated permease [Acidobacteriaceae bacterium]
MLSFGQDVRFALRQLRKSPGYALVAIFTLALGIGANTAIFLLTYSILLKSLPVPEPGRLVRYTLSANGDKDLWLTYPLYKAMSEHQTATSGIFAWWLNPSVPLSEHGSSSPVSVGMATGTVFPVLQLHPYLGRAFDLKSGQRGQPFVPEALLSYDFWRTHFNADPGVLGRTLSLDKVDLTVIGILPPGFEGISPETRMDILVPLTFVKAQQPKFAMIDGADDFWLQVMGRLRPGQSVTTAQAALAASEKLIFDDADPTHEAYGSGIFGGGFRVGVVPGRTGVSWLRTQYQTSLVALEGLCVLMMLLCAVNTALLILSRVSSRLHEFAVRSALGAARNRLIGQVLSETVLLAVAGLVLGSFLGWQLAHALLLLITPAGEPLVLSLQVGAVIVLFAVVLSLGAALLAGLWPAWRASRIAPALDLRAIHTQRGTTRMGRWIIPSQVALGIVLIYAALLLTGTLRNYLREHSGFSPHGVTLAELNYQNSDPTDQAQIRKGFQLVDTLEATPGIQAATLTSMLPVRGWSNSSDFFTRDGRGNLHHSDLVWDQAVTPGYFTVMGTAILEGRPFARADVSGDKVGVVSRSAANFFFPGQDPIGRTITAGDGLPPKHPSKDAPANAPDAFRIVGVAEDAHMQSLLTPAPMVVYEMAEQQSHPFVLQELAVRSANNGLAADAIRHATAEVLPGAAPPKIYTFDQAVQDNLSRQRLLSSVSGGFALLALALVATGLYGILARSVVDRRREIGIRMALGAQRQQIVHTLARTAASRISIGVIAGAALAFLAGRLLESLLYGVTAASLGVAAATLALLLAVLTLAFIVPAGRAASVNPMEAIREE